MSDLKKKKQLFILKFLNFAFPLNLLSCPLAILQHLDIFHSSPQNRAFVLSNILHYFMKPIQMHHQIFLIQIMVTYGSFGWGRRDPKSLILSFILNLLRRSTVNFSSDNWIRDERILTLVVSILFLAVFFKSYQVFFYHLLFYFAFQRVGMTLKLWLNVLNVYLVVLFVITCNWLKKSRRVLALLVAGSTLSLRSFLVSTSEEGTLQLSSLNMFSEFRKLSK